jgi:hypothetical protein
LKDACYRREVLAYDANTVDSIKPSIVPFGKFALDEVIKAFAAALLHPFKAEAEVNRKFQT